MARSKKLPFFRIDPKKPGNAGVSGLGGISGLTPGDPTPDRPLARLLRGSVGPSGDVGGLLHGHTEF